MPPGNRFVKLVGFNAVVNNFKKVRKNLGPATWVVGTPVEYSIYVEFGTSRMAAQPYLRPAVEHAKRNLASIIGNAKTLPEAIRAIALAIERKAKQLCPVDTGTLRASISASQMG